MSNGLRALGIPLVPRNWFWLKLAAIVLVLASVLAWFEPGFGLPYLVTAILLLPVLLPFLFSARVYRWGAALGGLGQVGLFAAMFAYIALVKVVVAPLVVAVFGYAT